MFYFDLNPPFLHLKFERKTYDRATNLKNLPFLKVINHASNLLAFLVFRLSF